MKNWNKEAARDRLRFLASKVAAWLTPHTMAVLSGLTGFVIGLLAMGFAVIEFQKDQSPQWVLILVFGAIAALIGAKIVQQIGALSPQRLNDLETKSNPSQTAQSENRYRDLLNSHDDFIIRRDLQGKLTYVNAAYCNFFNVTTSAVLGRAYQPNVIEGDDAPTIFNSDPTTRHDYKQKIESDDGAYWFALEDFAILDDDDKIIEIQTIGRNINQQKETEERLQKARDAADAANQAKSQFLATMSHEIRTPMNGILGMTNMLYDTDLSKEQQSYAKIIDKSAKSLLAIIDQILDFSKIEAGKIDLQSYPFDLRDVIQNVVELLAPQAYDKDLELGWYIDPNLPQSLMGDEVRIRQILTNLIGNAIKFTKHGGVSVEVKGANLPQEPADKKTLEILIRDTGIGLSKADQIKIFEEFEQADGSHSRHHEGSGLGLAIVQKIAEHMNGHIRVQSEKGMGATFVVTVQLACQEDVGKLYQNWELPQEHHNVLIAGCHPIEMDLMARSMEMVGLTVTMASSKTLVRKINQAARSQKPFDTLILNSADLDQTGAKYVQAMLKAYETLDIDKKPLILVTMDASQRGHFETYQELGVDAYLTRPIRATSLYAQLNSVNKQSSPMRTAPSLIENKAKQNAIEQGVSNPLYKVLLAEDNEINALLMKNMLVKSDCEIIHAETGRQAMEQLRTIVENKQNLDLILMDIHMPDMDGFEATSAIRSYLADVNAPNYLDLPIIAVTANAFPEDREKCLQAGFDDHLPKPFGKEQLAQMLSKWTIGCAQQDIAAQTIKAKSALC